MFCWIYNPKMHITNVSARNSVFTNTTIPSLILYQLWVSKEKVKRGKVNHAMSQLLSTLIIRTVTCVTRRFAAARCRHVQFISLLLARYINAIEGALLNKGCRNPRTEQRRFHCCRYVPAFLTSHVFLYSWHLQYVVIFINILLLNL